MAKKTEETVEEVKDFGNRPEIADGSNVPDMNVLAHNWQSGSPAIDMRDASANLSGAVNTVQKLADETDKVAEKAKALKIGAEEYKLRTKLPVDHELYINPSLDHHVSE